MTCKCGHGIEYHSFGPGLPVSCGKPSCKCVRYCAIQPKIKTVHNERTEQEEEKSG